jgi:hypothetical protein
MNWARQQKHGGDNPGHDQVADIDPSVVAPQANSVVAAKLFSRTAAPCWPLEPPATLSHEGRTCDARQQLETILGAQSIRRRSAWIFLLVP